MNVVKRCVHIITDEEIGHNHISQSTKYKIKTLVMRPNLINCKSNWALWTAAAVTLWKLAKYIIITES